MTSSNSKGVYASDTKGSQTVKSKDLLRQKMLARQYFKQQVGGSPQVAGWW